MAEDKNLDVSVEEARRLASRLGLAWAEGPHLEALAKAMTTMNAAGQTVPRVAGKMTQPAHVFRVMRKPPA